jgi:hypothetical protein
MTRALAVAGITLVALAVLVGCGNEKVAGPLGAGDFLAALTPQIDLRAALAAPLPTNTAAGSAANVKLLAAYQNESGQPQSAAELRQELQMWLAAVRAKPNDAAAQLGLSLVTLACAGQNAAHAIGKNLFEKTTVQDVAAMAFSSELGPEKSVSEGLNAALAAGLPQLRGGTSEDTRASDRPTPGELSKYRQAAQQLLLPPLVSVQNRVMQVADRARGTLRLVSVVIERKTYNLYGADFRALAAGLGLMRCAVLMAVSVDPNYGSFNWDLTNRERDRNHDGRLEVSDYIPAAPFLNVTAATWKAAGAALRDAVAEVIAAFDARVKTDPNELIMRALKGQNAADVRAKMGDMRNLLNGQVNVTAVYVVETGAGRTELPNATTTIPFNIRKLWDNPPASFRSLLPPVYLMLEYGHYVYSSGKFHLVVQERRTEPASVGYRVENWGGGGPVGYGQVPTAGPPHRLVIAKRGSFPGVNLTFPWDWGSFTGTIGGKSFRGTGAQVNLHGQVRWADLPDPTVRGIFPDPNKLKFFVYGNFSSLKFRYGSSEFGGG